MELRHLRYFIAVAEELNFSRAAERLHVSQPPLSRQIQDLEWELKVKLFNRNRSEVSLTQEGEKLLSPARKAVQAAESFLQNAKSIGKNRDEERIHIGCTPLGTAQIISGILAWFQTASSCSRAVLHDLSRSRMLGALRTKKLNVALTQRPLRSEMRGFNFETVCQYSVGVLCSKLHPIARQSAIHPSVVSKNKLVLYSAAQFPEYHKWVSKVLGLPKRSLAISQECNDILSLVGCVESGYGVAIVSQAVTAIMGDYVKFVPFGPVIQFLEVGLLYRKNEYNEDVKKLIAATLANKLQINCAPPAAHPRINGHDMRDQLGLHVPRRAPAKLLDTECEVSCSP
ncbi:MAG TPA: LysR family transcriptional regulator [Alphaproteobacteria bacterium]|nr:LysR family transcriptional regulator [Alphaproteobacteria bacterium]